MTIENKTQKLLDSPVALNWQGEKKKRWFVVSAACRHKPTGLIVVGARHFDKLMRAQIFALQGYDMKNSASGQWEDMSSTEDWKDLDQGFIDNHGDFLTRQEAWYLANMNNQIRFTEYSAEGMLFSESLY